MVHQEVKLQQKLKLSFERGGELELEVLTDVAPKTIEVILGLLPIENIVYHSRWSGREINTEIKTGKTVSRENQTIQTKTGDVVYWREWEKVSPEAAEVIAIYYGPELTRDHRGFQPVNVFATIDPTQWKLIEEIGIRIWRKGGELMRLTRG